jgi:cell fate regulator YaaT (PSP1 superfamily)
MSNRYVVRYGVMRSLGVFTNSRGETLRRGNRVIARTERGLEVGEVLMEAGDDVVAKINDPRRGQVLRVMTPDDERESRRLLEQQQREFETCKKHIAAMNLPMEMVDVEQMFGGERVVVYYLSEARVDFRELVKVLANEFQTRIEMRQIGVRDEAKLLADYGDCGKPVCCNTHLSEMPPVSMKMAKLQKATLDPTKISGRCGRLKCCLRYEYDTYEELQKDMPPLGADVLTRDGRVRVLAQEILAGQLLVETEDRRRVLIQTTDVLSVVPGTRRPPRDDGEGDDDRRGDDRGGEGREPRGRREHRGGRDDRPRRDDRGPRGDQRQGHSRPPAGDRPPVEQGAAEVPPQVGDAPPAAELPPAPSAEIATPPPSDNPPASDRPGEAES